MVQAPVGVQGVVRGVGDIAAGFDPAATLRGGKPADKTEALPHGGGQGAIGAVIGDSFRLGVHGAAIGIEGDCDGIVIPVGIQGVVAGGRDRGGGIHSGPAGGGGVPAVKGAARPGGGGQGAVGGAGGDGHIAGADTAAAGIQIDGAVRGIDPDPEVLIAGEVINVVADQLLIIIGTGADHGLQLRVGHDLDLTGGQIGVDDGDSRGRIGFPEGRYDRLITGTEAQPLGIAHIQRVGRCSGRTETEHGQQPDDHHQCQKQ